MIFDDRAPDGKSHPHAKRLRGERGIEHPLDMSLIDATPDSSGRIPSVLALEIQESCRMSADFPVALIHWYYSTRLGSHPEEHGAANL
jgi:hypothetical protein